MVFIYTLKLIQGKYYVGKTTNPSFRLDNHFNSNGSAWTMKYKPIELLELIPNCDDYDEDKYTRKYMDKYGIDNVRGGSFVKIELDPNTIDVLKQLNYGTKSGKLHYLEDCPIIIQKEAVNDEIVDEIEKLRQKIVELENVKRQKEIEEENAKKLTFEYYFQQLFDFIQMKKNNFIVSAKQERRDLVYALESIYSSLDIINTRLMKLEDAYIQYTQSK
jgi:hypothetical protein